MSDFPFLDSMGGEEATGLGYSDAEIRSFVLGEMSAEDAREFEYFMAATPELAHYVQDLRRELELERTESAAQENARDQVRTARRSIWTPTTWLSLGFGVAGCLAFAFALISRNPDSPVPRGEDPRVREQLAQLEKARLQYDEQSRTWIEERTESQRKLAESEKLALEKKALSDKAQNEIKELKANQAHGQVVARNEALNEVFNNYFKDKGEDAGVSWLVPKSAACKVRGDTVTLTWKTKVPNLPVDVKVEADNGRHGLPPRLKVTTGTASFSLKDLPTSQTVWIFRWSIQPTEEGNGGLIISHFLYDSKH